MTCASGLCSCICAPVSSKYLFTTTTHFYSSLPALCSSASFINRVLTLELRHCTGSSHLWRNGWTMARNPWHLREHLSCSLTKCVRNYRPIIFLLHLKHHHFLCPPILHMWVLFTPVTRHSQIHWYLGTRDCGLSACNMLIQGIRDSWNCKTTFLNKTISWYFSAVPLGKGAVSSPFKGLTEDCLCTLLRGRLSFFIQCIF